MCGYLVDWYAKHKAAGTQPSSRAIEQVYQTLGGKFGDASAICRPDAVLDKCQRFEVKQ